MINEDLPDIWYGGDYNPEQWEEEVWDEDIRMFDLAGIDVATLNVFSWALNQPDEETYDFTWLDEQIDRLYENGIYTCLATSTAAHPAWMADDYPDVLRVDYQGRDEAFGGRHNSCPNSPTYDEYAEEMADELGETYKDHPGVLIWHVSNEYGGYCYCDNCAASFEDWLQQWYGTLQNVNDAWNTRFWGHTFYDWDEIVPPNALSEEWEGDSTNFQGISLDYRIFQSDSLLECSDLEEDALEDHTPNLPVTTNLMGTYKELDYFDWGDEMDVVSWDNYPAYDTPVSFTAMAHDLMCGLDSGQPFMLMEQTPSQQNWQPYNSLDEPGVMELWSYQAVADGADTVMFFQLEESVGACECYHGAVIEHVGHENTDQNDETAALHDELGNLSYALLDARVQAEVAIVFDWENRWATELSSGPSAGLDYVYEVHNYYAALFDENIPVDMIGVDEDLSKYEIVIAPVLYMVKSGYADPCDEFVQNGGTFFTTFFSGIVNEHDLVTLGGYPGETEDLLGIWVEEIDALPPEEKNQIVITNDTGSLTGPLECELLFDIIHSEGADVLAEYGSDFYAGTPVITRHAYGATDAYYVGTCPDQAFLTDFQDTVCGEKEIAPLLNVPKGVEVTERRKDGASYFFTYVHNASTVELEIGEGTDLLTGKELTTELSLDPYTEGHLDF
nr:beta-galactosidase [uncultured bacterium]